MVIIASTILYLGLFKNRYFFFLNKRFLIIPSFSIAELQDTFWECG